MSQAKELRPLLVLALREDATLADVAAREAALLVLLQVGDAHRREMKRGPKKKKGRGDLPSCIH